MKELYWKTTCMALFLIIQAAVVNLHGQLPSTLPRSAPEAGGDIRITVGSGTGGATSGRPGGPTQAQQLRGVLVNIR